MAAVFERNREKGQGYILKENKPAETSPYKIKINAYRKGMFQLFAEHRIDVVYGYRDPLKFFIPAEYIAFPGNPDLESYFQTQQVFGGRQLSGKISLYRQE